jgi:ABC-type amino acid transport substrate-binding protein
MNARAMHLIAIVFGASLTVGLSAFAYSQEAPVRVVIKPLEPFVRFEGERNIGFSIELWEEVARRIGRDTQFVRVQTVS